MKFIKYPSLTNHYVARKQKFINLDDDYVSTEKIHGSNVSIIVDNENNIEVAKRTDFLTEEERTQRPWNTLAQFATEQGSQLGDSDIISAYIYSETLA